MKENSAQYDSLMLLWRNSHKEIKPGIISVADHVLKQFALGKHHCGCPNKSGTISMNDELWYPLDDLKAARYYREIISNEGNADDECRLLSNIWVQVLAETNEPKYLPVISHLADVEINGL